MSAVQSTKRIVKSLRNLAADPPPRNRTLTIEAVEPHENGIAVRFDGCKRKYTFTVSLPDELRQRLMGSGLQAYGPTLSLIAMAFAPFLYKLSDFRTVRMAAFPLDEESISFFERFLRGGLGEFRYIQGLDPSRHITVEAAQIAPPAPVAWNSRDHALMLNGGGKDTIVAGELLRLAGQPFTWMTVRPTPARRAVVELSGNPDSIETGYILDPEVDKYKAYPWGHFPHTSLVLSIGLLVAQLTDTRYVCVGNEHSANFGNVIHRGFEVNHQYSKSSAYEEGFSAYVHRCVTPDIDVFSLLRPFHDLQLAQLFAAFPRYHTRFISCNRGIGHNVWCKKCSKCAFTALALYPFVGQQGIQTIFGEDVLQRPAIRRHIVELASDGIKPWECVGTTAENRLALSLLLARNPELQFGEAPDRATLVACTEGFDIAAEEKRLLDTLHDEHLIPPELLIRLKPALMELAGLELRERAAAKP